MANTANEEYDNNSFTFYGPMEMAIDEDYTAFEATEIKIIITILLITIMIMSVVGNVSTCIVILRDNSMRTATNAYLFNLAVSDLLISLMIPIEVYTIWLPDNYPLGLIGCHVHSFLMNGLCSTSVLTISAFTIERYLVISKPFLRQSLSRTSRVFKIIALIWFISSCFCLPEVLSVDVLERKKHVYCYSTLSNVVKIFIGLQLLLFYVVPMPLLLVLYILIAIKLKSPKMRRSPVNGNQNRDKAVRMLAAVAGTFFFCWTPTVAMRVMMIFPKYSYEYYYDTWRFINYLSILNGYLTTIVNPILYSLMSRKFRQAFKDIFRGRKTSTQTKVGNTPTSNR